MKKDCSDSLPPRLDHKWRKCYSPDHQSVHRSCQSSHYPSLWVLASRPGKPCWIKRIFPVFDYQELQFFTKLKLKYNCIKCLLRNWPPHRSFCASDTFTAQIPRALQSFTWVKGILLSSHHLYTSFSSCYIFLWLFQQLIHSVAKARATNAIPLLQGLWQSPTICSSLNWRDADLMDGLFHG